MQSKSNMKSKNPYSYKRISSPRNRSLKHFKAIGDILTVEKFIENAHTCIKTENLCLLSVFFFFQYL